MFRFTALPTPAIYCQLSVNRMALGLGTELDTDRSKSGFHAHEVCPYRHPLTRADILTFGGVWVWCDQCFGNKVRGQTCTIIAVTLLIWTLHCWLAAVWRWRRGGCCGLWSINHPGVCTLYLLVQTLGRGGLAAGKCGGSNPRVKRSRVLFIRVLRYVWICRDTGGQAAGWSKKIL